MGDALAAQGAVGILDDPVAGHVDGGAAAGAGQLPDPEGLDLVTHLNAAHTLDTLVIVMEQGEGGGPGLPQSLGQLGLIGDRQDSQVIGDSLKMAVSAAHAGGAFTVMLREDQFHIGAAGRPGPWRVGMYHHPLPNRGVAGGDHGLLSLHLHTAHAAGGDLIDVL